MTTPGNFPATVTDKFGTATIKAAPEKVVCIGYCDQDAVLALGTVPTAVLQFVPYLTDGFGSWAQPLLHGARPTLLTSPVDFEKVGALDPDLITDVSGAGSADDHTNETRFAPTVGAPKGFAPYSVPWDVTTKQIAAALGKPAAGAQLVDQVQQTIAAAAAANRAAFAGKTFSVLYISAQANYLYTAVDARSRIMAGLGFTPAPGVTKLGTGEFTQQLSADQVGSAEADIVVAVSPTQGMTKAQALQALPTLAGLKAVQQNRFVFIQDYDVTMAMSLASVLSIPFALQRLVPLLTAALQ